MDALVPIFGAVAAVSTADPAAQVDEARVVIQTRAMAPGLDPNDLLRRCSQELRARGFVVEAVPVGVGDLDTELREAAAPAGAALAVGVVVLSRAAVEITVLDRVTGKRLSRALDLAASDNVESMVALATGELVEASLVELRLEHETLAPEVEVPLRLPVPEVPVPEMPVPEVKTPVPPELRWAADAALGVMWPTRTRRVGMELGLAFTGFPIRRLGVGLWIDAAALAPTGRYADVKVRGRPVSFGGALRGMAVLREHVVVPVELRAGAGVLLVDAGSSEEVQGRSFSRWLGMASLGSGVLGVFGRGHAGVLVRAALPLGSPRLTAVPDVAVPDEQIVVLDLRGPWLTASVVAGLRW